MDDNSTFDTIINVAQRDDTLRAVLSAPSTPTLPQSTSTTTTTATADDSSKTFTETNSGSNIKSCAGCGGLINERIILQAIDRFWHTACLKCTCCQAQLGDLRSCFTKGGMVLCKNDYFRLFASSGACATCGQNIPPSELVMKCQGNAYHLKCFTCVTCHGQLVPGDRYSIINGSLICEQDYPKVIKGHILLPHRGPHKVC